MSAGAAVQIVSSLWLASKPDTRCLFTIAPVSSLPTATRIKVKTTKAKSWKNRNSSITGEAASWNISCAQVTIGRYGKETQMLKEDFSFRTRFSL